MWGATLALRQSKQTADIKGEKSERANQTTIQTLK